MAVSFENGFDASQAFCANFGKIRAAMVNGWVIHCPQDSVRDIAGAGNLKKMFTRLISVLSHVCYILVLSKWQLVLHAE